MTESKKILLVFAVIMAIGIAFWAVQTLWDSKRLRRALKVLGVVALADLFLAGLFYIALKLLGLW